MVLNLMCSSQLHFGILRAELYATTNIIGIGISAFLVGGYATDVEVNIAQDKLQRCN